MHDRALAGIRIAHAVFSRFAIHGKHGSAV